MADETTTDTKIGIIEVNSDKLKNIDEFLKGDKNITRVDCPFPYVTSAVSAFENCTNLKSFNGNLNSFNAIEYYVDNESNNVSLDSLQYGNRMFYGCEKLETFTGDLPSLSTGNNMFYYTNISDFTTDLPNLTDGTKMFRKCGNLKTFKSNLESLSTYTGMFMDTKLNTFDTNKINTSNKGTTFMTDISLTNSQSSLRDFYCNLPNMTNTESMFKDYTSLEWFKSYMPKVSIADSMFANCSSLLTVDIGGAEDAQSQY
jgi:hypothetical protein